MKETYIQQINWSLVVYTDIMHPASEINTRQLTSGI